MATPKATTQPQPPAFTNHGQGSFHQKVKAPPRIGLLPSAFAVVPVATILLSGTTGAAYSETISAQGGIPPYTFSVFSGTLPTGTTLNNLTGVISGTTSAAGTFTFTIKAVDVNGIIGNQSFSITIAAPSGGGETSYAFAS